MKNTKELQISGHDANLKKKKKKKKKKKLIYMAFHTKQFFSKFIRKKTLEKKTLEKNIGREEFVVGDGNKQ